MHLAPAGFNTHIPPVFPFNRCGKIKAFVSVQGILRISGKQGAKVWKLKGTEFGNEPVSSSCCFVTFPGSLSLSVSLSFIEVLPFLLLESDLNVRLFSHG